MPHVITAKQRNSSFQHWCSQIARESRDLDALDRIAARALQDRDVRADGLLESMVRAELTRYRVDLEYAAHLATRQATSRPRLHEQYHAASGRDRAGLVQSRCDDQEDLEDVEAEFVILPEPPAPPPPLHPDEWAFRQSVERLGEAIETGDESGATTLCAQAAVLHQRRGAMVCAVDLERYQRYIARLAARLDEHRGEIAALAEQAQAAAQGGHAPKAVTLLRRLASLHVAHPRLLDEAGLAKVRDDVVRGNERYEDGVITRGLIERKREVAAELNRLAKAVFAYHRAVFNHPESGAEFRAAARAYLGALREIRLHEKDWLAEFVLELGDVLANWNVPPPGAEEQIDFFLEKLRGALHRIHAAMREIEVRRRGLAQP